MNTATAPIATMTSLSVLLHVAALAVLLLFEQTTTTGKGIEIELISSTRVSDQPETSQPRRERLAENNGQRQAMQPPAQKSRLKHSGADHRALQLPAEDKLLARQHGNQAAAEAVDKQQRVEQRNTGAAAETGKKHLQADSGIASDVQSTNARHRQHTIIELLHNSISNHKEYPYLARRQRREGVATVGFVLHPDGSVRDTHLVVSSRSSMLDRAALAAVQSIEPFTPARDYLNKAEEFSIDVVFKLL